MTLLELALSAFFERMRGCFVAISGVDESDIGAVHIDLAKSFYESHENGTIDLPHGLKAVKNNNFYLADFGIAAGAGRVALIAGG